MEYSKTMTITAASTIEVVRKVFPDAIIETSEFRDEWTLIVRSESLVELCRYLKQELSYEMLETVTAVDWLDRVPRFDIVYQLLSLTNQCFVRLKVRVGARGEQQPSVPSVTAIWAGANWYEREVFDLFGIVFNVKGAGHPDLRRILMPSDWTTHPLRKDYPISGFDLPEPYWGGQVPYSTDSNSTDSNSADSNSADSNSTDYRVGECYHQTLRTPEGRALNESRSKVNPNQEPGTPKAEGNY